MLCVTNLFYFQETGKENEKTLESYNQALVKTNFVTSRYTKRKASVLNANSDFMQVCKRALETSNVEPTEYEIVGMNVAKKLAKMNSSQAIFAETLINFILTKGLFNELTANTIISEKQEFNNMLNNCNTPCTSTLMTGFFSPNSVEQNNIAEHSHDNSNSSYTQL